MRNRFRYHGLILLVIFTTLIVTGCVTKPAPGQEDPNVPVTYNVSLYYVNQEYVETGDENLSKLIEEPSTIEVGVKDNPYLVLMDALRQVSDEGMTTMISENVTFNDIYIEEGQDDTIVVDLKKDGLSGGSLGEGLFISQVVETLLNNGTLTEPGKNNPVQVQFLVDGEITESLMGHIDATQPFKGEK